MTYDPDAERFDRLSAKRPDETAYAEAAARIRDKAGPMLPKHVTADSIALALQLRDDLERSGVAQLPPRASLPRPTDDLRRMGQLP